MTDKCKVTVIGSFITEEGRRRIAKAERVVKQNPTVNIEVVTIREEVTKYLKQPIQETDWLEEYLEYFREAIHTVDKVIILTQMPTVALGWVMGYAWAWGKPMLLIVPEPLNLMGFNAIDSITATLKSINDLKKYDFKEMPYIYEGAEVSAL
ncbi:hypothetical protein ACTOS9_12015 [Bacillus subtilis]|uniref:Uncharacterized protein n=1 Tax=Bacillus subtilis TaxID=1423 RepID=A0AAX3RJH6_BACIU|nr:hypothetical protein [Bacillus subtilis]MEC0364266.1 hypothetical protein [Bacillus subtilis]WEY83277.1 hypothetical protein P5633_12600 [Bacillus subtilis]WGD61738.1 hypothetical protein P5648_12235 [Bacillus subtilis]WGD72379.1 hypothetical protein P5645_10180 [Bacillus subtilis]